MFRMIILNIVSGDALSRKLIIAKEERDVQLRAFAEVRDTVTPQAAEQWVNEVKAWEKERILPVKNQKAPNPYELPKNGQFSVPCTAFPDIFYLTRSDGSPGAPATTEGGDERRARGPGATARD